MDWGPLAEAGCTAGLLRPSQSHRAGADCSERLPGQSGRANTPALPPACPPALLPPASAFSGLSLAGS